MKLLRLLARRVVLVPLVALALVFCVTWVLEEGARREAVCRAGIADIMDFDAGTGHIDPNSQSAFSGYPDVDMSIVSPGDAAVHDARCGFSIASVFWRDPVLDSVAIDDIAISPIRIKLLGIALGVATDPEPASR